MNKLSVEELFEIKKKFLSEIPHPTLILKHIRTLSNSIIKEDEQIRAENPANEELAEYLSEYIEQLMPTKLSIANANDAEELFSILLSLYVMQWNLINKLASYYPAEKEPDYELVKQSEPLDVYEYLKELQLNQIQENQINGYLCRQLETEDESQFSALCNGIIRAKKIQGHGR